MSHTVSSHWLLLLWNQIQVPLTQVSADPPPSASSAHPRLVFTGQEFFPTGRPQSLRTFHPLLPMTVPQYRHMQIDLSTKIPFLRVPSSSALLPQFPATTVPFFHLYCLKGPYLTDRTSLPGNLAPWAQNPSPVPSLSIKLSLFSIPAVSARAPQRGQARLLIMP